ncbi:putative fungal specific transcription factor domain-containing protein [Rosellinia necatrix]|uniref:Putative fungal specific transcription factor domain-containing protein n=1 Tax=Rosellinia necatrix TaxID=77044 RepID=A0A1W2TTI1_ROSNE|nr:putative fungal specific transcription factor domain-containing protein [Rosellinia necatrix]
MSAARGTSLRAGGACVRCRKGKTKCVYENGRAPCKNCAKGMHECYLPSETNAHLHGQSPARTTRPRESLPGDRNVAATSDRQPAAAGAVIPRSLQTSTEKLTPELIVECERVINKTLPSCVAFHKPSFLQNLKNGTLEPSIVNGLLTCAARSSPTLIRRFGSQSGGASAASEHFAVKALNLVMQNLDNPSLADIQALCLLTIHEWGNRNAVRAYVYLGQAARMTQMYRVITGHQTHGDPDQFIKDESFRRTLWLIYVLDCFLTSSPGRHPAVSHHDVKDVPLPCPDMSYNFGTPAFVRTLAGNPPPGLPEGAPMAEVGEFGHIVMATQAWRNVIEMLTTVTVDTYTEDQCLSLEAGIEAVRASLPMHFGDKPGHINLHITMGSGFTYAMLHCLLHCATIMVHRRRLLHFIQTESFKHETWRTVPHLHLQTVDRVFAASHSVVSLLLALEANADKDSMPNFPLVMLFSCFTACATVAWFSLKGLTPADVNETAEAIVGDGMRFLQDGANTWVLAVPWYRHLAVMAKVLRNDDRDINRVVMEPALPSVKDDTASQPDNTDSMDYERHSSANPQELGENNGIEPPRKSGFTTINGGSAGTSTPATATASPPAQTKAESPVPSSSDRPAVDASAGVAPADMTSAELCVAFERQLLELDDLAAFMGGGV